MALLLSTGPNTKPGRKDYFQGGRIYAVLVDCRRGLCVCLCMCVSLVMMCSHALHR